MSDATATTATSPVTAPAGTATAPVTAEPNLAVTVAGLRLKNPVINASGTFGYGTEYARFADPARLGAVVTKSLTAAARPGALPYRVVATASGALNAIGIANCGVDAFRSEKAPLLKAAGIGYGSATPVFASIAGHTVDDYVAVAGKLESEPAVAGVELNISCPNTATGLDFGVTPEGVRSVVGAVRKVVKRLKVLVKLSPNVTDIRFTARAAVEAGADALSMINTLSGMAVDPETRRPRIGNVTGGLSGPAIKPVAVRMIHQVYRDVARAAGVPIIGMGGIVSAADAVEFLLVGATAVGVGSATFADPAATVRLVEGLRAYCLRHGVRDIGELTGAVRLD
jgi:dihydroorotate dehydrogenase (NAD+) catalytic subunit